MRGLAFAAGMVGGLLVATQSALAVDCGPIVDGASVLTAQAIKASKRMLAVPMFKPRSATLSAARCSTQRLAIAAWQKELAYMRSHPECYSEENTATTRRIIASDTKELKSCR